MLTYAAIPKQLLDKVNISWKSYIMNELTTA